MEGQPAGGTAGDSEGMTPDARAKLMQEVAAQMDAIERGFGEDFEIGRVITVVEVKNGADVNLRVRAQMLPWVALGMLRMASRSVGG